MGGVCEIRIREVAVSCGCGAAVLIGKGSTVGGFVTPKHLHISRYFVGGVCHPEAKKQHESG